MCLEDSSLKDFFRNLFCIGHVKTQLSFLVFYRNRLPLQHNSNQLLASTLFSGPKPRFVTSKRKFKKVTKMLKAGNGLFYGPVVPFNKLQLSAKAYTMVSGQVGRM